MLKPKIKNDAKAIKLSSFIAALNNKIKAIIPKIAPPR
jgi:hypothetical protein